ncbi:MAG: iron ABC transporter permease [Planctomycetes bacterium]|nr:iron ABC transporter permease [Planctomycetota bacterium]
MTPRATPRRLALALAILGGATGSAFLLAAAVGPAGGIHASWEIVRDLRLPRAALAALVGGALGVSGAAFQALLRNPLACPYLLGVSGGGAFGAVLAILLGLPDLIPGLPLLPVVAFTGCLGAIALIHAVARRRGHLLAHDLLLAGVVANSFFLAAMSVLQYLAAPYEASRILHWTLGAVRPDSVPLPATTLLVLAAAAALYFDAGRLNLLAVGDETAAMLGVDVTRVRRRAFVAASLLTGAAVAVSGPIGFVGLFVPHALRAVLGPDHRVLLPACLLGGAAFLVVADTAARAAFGPYEIPVGVLTAVVGAPVFVVLLARRERRLPEGTAP